MVDEWVLNLGLIVLGAIMGAILGSLVGFFLGLKITRRAQINDAKFRVYEQLYPAIEESNEILFHTISIRQIDFSNVKTKEEVLMKLFELGAPLFYLEDTGIIDDVLEEYIEDSDDDISSFDVLYEAMKGDWPEYFQEVRDRTLALLVNKFSQSVKQISQHQSVIQFAEPSQEVMNALKDIQLLIGGDFLKIGLRELFGLSGLGKLIPPTDVEKRGQLYQDKLDALRKAMDEDLKNTYKLF